MIYISIGSNLGNRLDNLQQALVKIAQAGFTILKASPILETPALLPLDAPNAWNRPFLNRVIAGEYSGSPAALLQALKHIEQALGRQSPYPKWSPRLIDLDILMFNHIHINTPDLTLPHPELPNRKFLQDLLKFIIPTTQLVGILNITPDSFSDGNQYVDPQKAIHHALRLQQDGADIIEIGAQSTRPGAALLTPYLEYKRLEPVLSYFSKNNKTHITFALDCFSEPVILKVIHHFHKSNLNLKFINDVKGLLSPDCLGQIAEFGYRYIAMHTLDIPANKNSVIAPPPGQSSMDIILNWAVQKTTQLKKTGFNSHQIILDPGLGYSKNIYQDWEIIQNISRFQALGYAVYMGHSRKFFLTALNPASHPADRDSETLAISDYLVNNNIEYLRVHNIAAHQRFLSAALLLKSSIKTGETP